MRRAKQTLKISAFITDPIRVLGFYLTIDVDAEFSRSPDSFDYQGPYGLAREYVDGDTVLDELDLGDTAYLWNEEQDEALALPIESLRTSIRERLEKAYRDLVLEQANESSKWQEEERDEDPIYYAKEDT